MKYLLFYILLHLSVTSHCQDKLWIDLKYPQSGLLGSAILKIEDGEILENRLVEKTPLSITQSAGPEYFASCEKQLKSKIETKFKGKGIELRSVKIRNLKIQSISSEDIGKLNSCNCIVYEGMCANSYEINITKKSKSQSTDLFEIFYPLL